MMYRKIFSHLTLCFLTSLAVFTVGIPEKADARGFGGGGMSRGGPAAGGSVRSRPSSRPTTRPSTRPSSRPSTGQVSKPSTQRSPSSNIRDNRTDRRDNTRDNRQERRDVKRDNRGERREVRQDVRHERHERHEWHEDRWKRRTIGAALTIATYSSLSCTRTTVFIGGVTYYRCGGDWYQRVYRSSEVVYIVVQAPTGY